MKKYQIELDLPPECDTVHKNNEQASLLSQEGRMTLF